MAEPTHTETVGGENAQIILKAGADALDILDRRFGGNTLLITTALCVMVAHTLEYAGVEEEKFWELVKSNRELIKVGRARLEAQERQQKAEKQAGSGG